MQRKQAPLLLGHACRLTAVSDAPRDYFDRARLVAATGLFVGAICLITGCFLDWVTVDQLPEVIPADQAAKAQPINGFDVRDGYVIAAAGLVLLISAVRLVLQSRGAGIAFLAAVVAGGVAISDYRGVDEMFVQLDAIGRGPHPGIGLILVAIGALVSLVSAVAAIAATPRRAD